MAIVVDPSLAPADIAVYNAVKEAILDHDISPTKGELRKAIGYEVHTIDRALEKLVKGGYITREKFKTRSTRLVDPAITLVREPLAPWEEDLTIPRIWAD